MNEDSPPDVIFRKGELCQHIGNGHYEALNAKSGVADFHISECKFPPKELDVLKADH